MKHQCFSCKFAELNVPPPDGGGDEDGVNCRNRKHAINQKALDEFEAYGFVNLWKIEAMDEDAECPDWEQQEK